MRQLEFLTTSSRLGNRICICSIFAPHQQHIMCSIFLSKFCERVTKRHARDDDILNCVLHRHSSFSVTSGTSEKGLQRRENHEKENFCWFASAFLILYSHVSCYCSIYILYHLLFKYSLFFSYIHLQM